MVQWCMPVKKDFPPPDSPYIVRNLSTYSDEVALLLSCARPKRFAQGEMVYQQGEESRREFYFIESGRVKHSLFGKKGTEKTFTILEKGAFFGYAASLDGYPHFTTATTLEKTVLQVIRLADFRRLVEKHPRISFMMMESFARILRVFILHIQDSSFLNAKRRVAHMLYKLVMELGQQTPKGMLISKKFTQEDLASLMGLSRVSVSLTLSYFESLGILRKKRHTIEVLDVERLKHFAGDDESRQ